MSERALITHGRSDLFWVTGGDAVSFLDGLISQNISAIPAGGTGRSLLLAPNGKLRALLFVLRDNDRVGLVCDSGVAVAAKDDLRRFRIRVDVEFEDEPRPIWEVWGERAAELVKSVPPAGRWAEDGGTISFSMPLQRVDIDRVVVVGTRPEVGSEDPDALERLRIAAGEPVMGVDVDEKTIPQEAVDVYSYVDFGKGCYLGQELVARIDSRGHVNRRLSGLVLDGEELPRHGEDVIAADKRVGKVTSATRSERHGGVLALGMIRVEVEPETAVTVGGVAGRVVALPIR